jgi:hypothetical protein
VLLLVEMQTWMQSSTRPWHLLLRKLQVAALPPVLLPPVLLLALALVLVLPVLQDQPSPQQPLLPAVLQQSAHPSSQLLPLLQPQVHQAGLVLLQQWLTTPRVWQQVPQVPLRPQQQLVRRW